MHTNFTPAPDLAGFLLSYRLSYPLPNRCRLPRTRLTGKISFPGSGIPFNVHLQDRKDPQIDGKKPERNFYGTYRLFFVNPAVALIVRAQCAEVSHLVFIVICVRMRLDPVGDERILLLLFKEKYKNTDKLIPGAVVKIF